LAGAGFALVLLVLAGVAIRDLIVRAGWVPGHEWLGGAAHWGANENWQAWMWVLVAALLFAGLAMVWLAVKPRRHRYLAVGDASANGNAEQRWTRPGDIARRCSAVVAEQAGVDAVSTHYGRRKVTVTVTGDHGVVDTDVIGQAVRGVLASLGLDPKVAITVTDGRGVR
ncbi:MAG: DUF6286 domain-containing protein, partial [Gordonia sp. (in: high G+C Gram-positive bacteria)]|uniref:DUF6286 domain-containing protein n=1 Tax=Gordonia sp. (in: high G+C Gram-positive bacteria) TaxID=84139 RepID=UPI003BB79B0B